MDSVFVMAFVDSGKRSADVDAKRLHVTFMAHLLINNEAKLNVFVKKVQMVAEKTEPFDLVVKERKFFGVNEDFSVMVLDDNRKEASFLHNELLSFSGKLGFVVKEPFYAGENFIPHITFTESLPFQVGDKVRVEQLTVVRWVNGLDSHVMQTLGVFDLKK